MKKIGAILSLIVILIGFAGCSLFDKTFTKAGVTVTLNSSFYEKDIIQAEFYLESTQHLFMANGESKSLMPSISNAEEYVSAVLRNAGKSANEILMEENNSNPFWYAYYTSTVDGSTFGYMLVGKEGATKFYAINFACRENNLERNKETYIKWAKTIIVE